MKINVYGVELEQDREFNSLEEILMAIEAKNYVLVKLLADKQEVTSFEELQTMGQIEELEIYTKSIRELVIDSIKDGQEYLPRLITGLENVIKEYSSGNETKGNELLAQALEGFAWLNSLAANLGTLNQETAESEESLTELSSRWKENINELHQAMQLKDTVLISDLLEYEIIPLIENYLTYITAVEKNIQ